MSIIGVILFLPISLAAQYPCVCFYRHIYLHSSSKSTTKHSLQNGGTVRSNYTIAVMYFILHSTSPHTSIFATPYGASINV